VGQAYRALENYQKAIETQKQRLTIAREFKNTWMESESLTELGISHSAIQENRQAISYHQQSIVLYHQRHKEFLRKYPPKDPSNVSRPYGIGEALMHLGDAYYHNGDYEKAIATYQESLGPKSPTGGGSTFDNTLNTRLGNTFANIGKFSEAELALKSAIGFEDMFRQAITDKSTDINRINYAERLAENYRLLQQVLVRQNRTNDALEIAEESRARVFVEQLASRVSGLPLLKDTALSQPPKLAAMRQIVTDQNATLVQYSLADKDLLYIWVMKPNGAIAFKTVNLKDNLRPINDLITHSRQAIGVRAAIKISSASGVSREDSTLRDLRDLYKILIEPIAAELPNDPNQRVIFIPQGELFLVPFPALKNAQGKYLIEQHTISSAPSIQTLNLTRKQRTVLPRANTIPLIVGNPIMPRLKGETLLPLPGAEKEALTIAQLFNTTALIGGEATKSTVLNRMKSASIIHLLTRQSKL
jgi:CHAT domain-containing protein